MQLMRWKLDENENRESMRPCLLQPDHFWKNSRVVLRNAFYRFTQGIRRRIRLSNVYSLLHHYLSDTSRSTFGCIRSSCQEEDYVESAASAQMKRCCITS